MNRHLKNLIREQEENFNQDLILIFKEILFPRIKYIAQIVMIMHCFTIIVQQATIVKF